MFKKIMVVVVGLGAFCLYAHHDQQVSREAGLQVQVAKLQQEIGDLQTENTGLKKNISVSAKKQSPTSQPSASLVPALASK